MLSQLSVKNLAVVEKLDLSFTSGMSTVTGETGAGKSILLQALNLALGHRSDSTLVRHGKDKAEVSAVFEVENQQKIHDYLKQHSLDEDGECVLRRIVTSDGRSKAFINGTSVPLSVLRGVGELLIDMHGQNEHQLLLRPDQQRDLLDAYAQNSTACVALNVIVAEYNTICNTIDELNNNQDLKQQQQELLHHQLDELEAAALIQEDLDTIENDFKASANAASLIEQTSTILSQLEEENGVNTQLMALSYSLSQAANTDEKLAPIAELLTSAQVQTQESIYELTRYLSALSFDEETTKNLEERLSELHNLARKHSCQITELIEVKNKISTELDVIGDVGASINDLEEQKAALTKHYNEKSDALSKVRTEKAKRLSHLVTEAMQVLGMPGSAFIADLPKKAEGVHYNGNENINFLVKTNMGSDFKALKKVASGGELSRISLAISVISSDSEYTPTLIFDEVDVGISGAVAEVVGQKLKQLSNNYQILCITHLAQVAAFGHQHLRVHKSQTDDGAQTTVMQLSNDERIDEIARILGGAIITDNARNAAAEMIKLSL
ncbi:DNA repair protein RecN [Bathymodiolus septemdierum thioautotrophic gill symbiont]|uniref:DNA repair protein RecN n=1 Tax=endosymbiont of Bathymodiolus septemdierum str. Myojin knoll TaxID=1303921 RepID=A0A0P0UT11_9GAMM|nr:DNA repair protein RecN [Bathymodiolus septemdierum thioautotrophic gill symbiont]BAS68453.1 DNA repair protein RecN [endosymbiont of Bathymodiolus septemdierum str. Myojin knoll]